MIAAFTLGWWVIPSIITLVSVTVVLFHPANRPEDEYGMNHFIWLCIAVLVSVWSWVIYGLAGCYFGRLL